MLYIEIASKPTIWSCLVFQDTLATLEQEMLEESRSMRLAIGHFVDKEPHLDLVTVPWWLLWYPLIASMRPVWYSYVCIGLPMPHVWVGFRVTLRLTFGSCLTFLGIRSSTKSNGTVKPSNACDFSCQDCLI